MVSFDKLRLPITLQKEGFRGLIWEPEGKFMLQGHLRGGGGRPGQLKPDGESSI